MLGDRRRRFVDALGEIVDTEFAVDQRPQQLHTGGVGQHAEDLNDQQRMVVGKLPICIHTQIIAEQWNKSTRSPVWREVNEHTLVVYANPRGPASRANAALLRAVTHRPDTETRDLIALYPDGLVDVTAEQAALERADQVVLQYPTYWYSMPGPMKNWLDQVMTPGWAYGPGAPGVLAGKTLRIATTTGGVTEDYQPGRLHGFEYADLLAPLRATARRLGMQFAEPLVLHGVRHLSDDELAAAAARYEGLLAETPAPATRPELPWRARSEARPRRTSRPLRGVGSPTG
ncbi:hypothetical protein MAIC_25990 [Mycolicibacterium aichiense]|uniref:Flavodoxin-like fold domain-containing protein n=1 Tax=Mycolicibacterium aichiense TaxID=1799 RepID=A0AAD1HMH3_9MYCO|nr:hypothetical protein MAIC_25990 [Mycolicibacterium aichiense]